MPKLAIISHTKHFINTDGEIVGWEPTVREINHLINIFDGIYHVAPLYKAAPHQANIPYSSNKTIFIPIIPTGGSGLIKKLTILLYLPFNLYKIIKVLRKVDWIHFRAPTNLGLIILPVLILYRNKKKWVKYAGNWGQKGIPFSYALQRWWLKNNINQSKVTINGIWDNQKPHLLSLHNPCMDEKELYLANEIGSKKIFSGRLNLCFIGRIDSNKGITNILKALRNLDTTLRRIKEINIAGGIDGNSFEPNIDTNNIQINYLGWVNRSQLNKIYRKSHIIILPTQSEGFPKVIAEASAYGCVPVVTNISPINQYIIHEKNGLLLDKPSVQNIQDYILKIEGGIFNLKNISTLTMKIANKFTFEYYINRIRSEIVDA